MTGTGPASFTVDSVVIISFDNAFFVAMYNSSKTASSIFRVTSVSSSPAYADIENTAGSTLTYYTD